MLESDRDRRVSPAVLLVATNLNDLDRLMLFAFEQSAASRARLLLLHVVSPSITLNEEPDGVFDQDRAGSGRLCCGANLCGCPPLRG